MLLCCGTVLRYRTEGGSTCSGFCLWPLSGGAATSTWWGAKNANACKFQFDKYFKSFGPGWGGVIASGWGRSAPVPVVVGQRLQLLGQVPVCWSCHRSNGWSKVLLLSSGLLLASGLRLMTNSSRSPASVISGTARQQSKSLVLTWFTCTPHRERRRRVRMGPGRVRTDLLVLKCLIDPSDLCVCWFPQSWCSCSWFLALIGHTGPCLMTKGLLPVGHS